MTSTGKDIYILLLKQVYNPDKLIANKLIKPKQGGTALNDDVGYGKDTVRKRFKKLKHFLKKFEAEFIVTLLDSE